MHGSVYRVKPLCGKGFKMFVHRDTLNIYTVLNININYIKCTPKRDMGVYAYARETLVTIERGEVVWHGTAEPITSQKKKSRII